MLAATLSRLISDKLTNANEIAQLTGVATSTVYRWISGESEPDFHSMRLLVKHLPDQRAQCAIVDAFLAGTPWHAKSIETNLDVNRDGRVDVNDALDACIESVQAAGESLSQVRVATSQKLITSSQCANLVSLLNEVIRDCTAAEQVLMRISAKKSTGN